MNFSKTTSYALRILSYMAQKRDKVYSASYLHEELDIPQQYLKQLLTSLAKSGFIRSVRGRGGGFVFNKNVEDIYIAEIIEAVEDLDGFNKCIMGFDHCPFDHSCALHETWLETRSNILNVLKTTPLSAFEKK